MSILEHPNGDIHELHPEKIQNMATETQMDGNRLAQGVELIISGLSHRDQLGRGEIEGLCRDLQSLAEGPAVRISSEEQLKAERIIAYMFRPTVEQCLSLWFGKSAETDTAIWQMFGEDVERASAGEYDHWALSPNHPRMLLALILLLDQYRRNIFRDNPQMYAADARCQSLVRRAIQCGVVHKLQLIERVFPCLVLTHSENLKDQHLCMEEWAKVELELSSTDPLRVFQEIFKRHVEVIDRFGRFPHRNDLVDRITTPEEEDFLNDADFRFDLPLVQRTDGSFCFQGSIGGRQVKQIEGESVTLSYIDPDTSMAQAEQQIRMQGYAEIGSRRLRKFIVERDMPCVGSKKYDEMKVETDRVNRATQALWPRMSWVESFMCNNKMYCIYLADHAMTLEKHALLADVPLSSVREVNRIIDQGSFTD